MVHVTIRSGRKPQIRIKCNIEHWKSHHPTFENNHRTKFFSRTFCRVNPKIDRWLAGAKISKCQNFVITGHADWCVTGTWTDSRKAAILKTRDSLTAWDSNIKIQTLRTQKFVKTRAILILIRLFWFFF